MSIDTEVTISESPQYGVVLECRNAELADLFDDFLNERCEAQFDIKLEPERVIFYMGQEKSVDDVRKIFDRFLREMIHN